MRPWTYSACFGSGLPGGGTAVRRESEHVPVSQAMEPCSPQAPGRGLCTAGNRKAAEMACWILVFYVVDV